MIACVLRGLDVWTHLRRSFHRRVVRFVPGLPEDDRSSHAATIWQYLDEVLVSFYSGDDVPIRLEDARSELANLLEPYSRFGPLVQAVPQPID